MLGYLGSCGFGMKGFDFVLRGFRAQELGLKDFKSKTPKSLNSLNDEA